MYYRATSSISLLTVLDMHRKQLVGAEHRVPNPVAPDSI